jgi:hypothetical protein
MSRIAAWSVTDGAEGQNGGVCRTPTGNHPGDHRRFDREQSCGTGLIAGSTGSIQVLRTNENPTLRRVARLLLIAFLTLSTLWFASVSGTATRQRYAVSTINGVGATIYYDWMIQPIPGTPNAYVVTDPNECGGPKALRRLLGNDYFQHVVRISNLDPKQVDDQVLLAVGNLPELQYITLMYDRTNERMTSAEIRNLKSRIQRVCNAQVYGPYNN